MKFNSLFIALTFSLLASSLSADVVVSAKVLDRAGNGTAIRNQHVYPQVALESGETASLHIGEVFRYQIAEKPAEPEEGAEPTEAVQELYAEKKIGLNLSLAVTSDESGIAYRGEAASVVVNGVSDAGSSFGTSEVVFYGKVASGEMITVQMKGANGTAEVIALHFEQR